MTKTRGYWSALWTHNEGFIFCVLSVFLMSSGPVVNKFILQTSSPEFSSFVNAVISTCFFSVLQISSGKKFKFYFNRSTILSGIFSGLGLSFLFLALQFMHPAIVGFVGRLGVVFAMVLSSLFLKHRPDKPEVLLGVLAVGGALGSAVQDFGGSSLLGFAFALGSTLSFACSNLSLKFATTRGSSSQILASSNLVSAVLLFVLCVFSPRPVIIPQDLRSWEFIIGGALFGSCLGFWFFLESLKHLSLSRASLVRATGPLFTAAVSYPFFGLHFNWVQLTSAGVLLFSVLALSVYERGKSAKVARVAASTV